VILYLEVEIYTDKFFAVRMNSFNIHQPAYSAESVLVDIMLVIMGEGSLCPLLG
jgi:hypothetical protein